MPKRLGSKSLKKIRVAAKDDGQRFPKIENVFIYEQLGIPMPPIYILDDRKEIDALAAGRISQGLKSDLEHLIRGSLVIRSDITDRNLPERQLLPRSNELRDIEKATAWLIENSSKLTQQFKRSEVALLLHNFIPSISSAFSYSAPKERIVGVEGLWGIPEGLYYNAHDKFIVDTGTPDVSQLNRKTIQKFTVKPHLNFKHFFVSPDATGDWTRKIVKAPHDWNSSLQDDWCQTIAYNSRRISGKLGKPVSIMWFAGLGGDPSKVIPWYHEHMQLSLAKEHDGSRRKTVFDKSFIIETSADMAELERASNRGDRIRRIRIMPKDEALLREKTTLEKIGSIAKKLDATIILEGGILSHAYYQLSQTKAIVEVAHPFLFPDEKHEYNKLVRDKIPSNITRVGEEVKTLELRGDALIKALKNKLIEEAIEVVDTTDQRAILIELADVMEIVDELLARLQLTRDELVAEQKAKRKSRGGFKKGLVLVETINVLSRSGREEPIQAELLDPDKINPQVLLTPPVPKVERRVDKRKVVGGLVLQLNLSVPLLSPSWSESTPSQTIGGVFAKEIDGAISGERKGSKISIELSINIRDSHPELDFIGEQTPGQRKSAARGRSDAR